MRQLSRRKRFGRLLVGAAHQANVAWGICNTVAPEAPFEIKGLGQCDTCYTTLRKLVRERDKELPIRNCTVATVAVRFAPSRARATERLDA